MKINEFDDIAINGQFDLIFKEKCPEHPKINWKLLKSLAFNESALQPFVSGGLFRIPERLFFEHSGKDPTDPEDAVKTIVSIFSEWWEKLYYIPENDRLLFLILAYKMHFFDVQNITKISNKFDDLYQYISPGLLLEVKKIVDRAEVM
jgi:membrane-bound lytic murein transglycosylase MltF